jgi:hypothetical protein
MNASGLMTVNLIYKYFILLIELGNNYCFIIFTLFSPAYGVGENSSSRSRLTPAVGSVMSTASGSATGAAAWPARGGRPLRPVPRCCLLPLPRGHWTHPQ